MILANTSTMYASLAIILIIAGILTDASVGTEEYDGQYNATITISITIWV